jgi:phosphatidylserine decarboxylase
VLAPGAGRLVGPVAIVLAVALVLVALGWWPLGPLSLVVLVLLAGFTTFLLVFFRDPERSPGAGIVSAADGRIRAVEQTGDRWRISVFMNVTNVHVNRLPLDGEVETIETSGTGFRPAYQPAADRNVQRRYALRTALGPVEIVQITGIVARRLVSFVRVGSVGRKGERFGMIVLGSRVDVLLPSDRTRPVVTVGQRVWAGQSTIAVETP